MFSVVIALAAGNSRSPCLKLIHEIVAVNVLAGSYQVNQVDASKYIEYLRAFGMPWLSAISFLQKSGS